MIQVILLDIEGTTCPVDFVAKTLFPYAQAHLNQTLAREKDEPRMTNIIQEAINEWQKDLDPTCQKLLAQTNQFPPSNAQVAEYLQQLITWHRAIFSGGYPPNIVAADAFHNRVRDGSEWDHTAMDTRIDKHSQGMNPENCIGSATNAARLNQTKK